MLEGKVCMGLQTQSLGEIVPPAGLRAKTLRRCVKFHGD
jgi:hypothetical protein